MKLSLVLTAEDCLYARVIQTEKTRVGIGAYFKRSETHPDALEVKSILPRSAAETCNLISPGDHIIAVDGEPVSGKSLAQLATKVCL
jgi:C-terminal processing protease CtpA/Prc